MHIPPRDVKLEDCDFYHSFTLSGRDVTGHWDLRDNWEPYLGHVNFSGRSVLEIGPASGFLSFCMESAGAQVTALEPPMSHLWDVVPSQGIDLVAWRNGFSRQIERVRKTFWYAHA